MKPSSRHATIALAIAFVCCLAATGIAQPDLLWEFSTDENGTISGYHGYVCAPGINGGVVLVGMMDGNLGDDELSVVFLDANGESIVEHHWLQLGNSSNLRPTAVARWANGFGITVDGATAGGDSWLVFMTEAGLQWMEDDPDGDYEEFCDGTVSSSGEFIVLEDDYGSPIQDATRLLRFTADGTRVGERLLDPDHSARAMTLLDDGSFAVASTVELMRVGPAGTVLWRRSIDPFDDEPAPSYSVRDVVALPDASVAVLLRYTVNNYHARYIVRIHTLTGTRLAQWGVPLADDQPYVYEGLVPLPDGSLVFYANDHYASREMLRLDRHGRLLDTLSYANEWPSEFTLRGMCLTPAGALVGVGTMETWDSPWYEEEIAAFAFDMSAIAAPELFFSLYPQVQPMLIPPFGRSFFYHARLVNPADTPFSGDGWASLRFPGGPETVLAQVPVTLAPGQVRAVAGITVEIPSYLPSGDYTVIGRAGEFPTTVAAADSFFFHKAAVTAGADTVRAGSVPRAGR